MLVKNKKLQHQINDIAAIVFWQDLTSNASQIAQKPPQPKPCSQREDNETQWVEIIRVNPFKVNQVHHSAGHTAAVALCIKQ